MTGIFKVVQFDLANIGDEPADDVGHCGRGLNFAHRKFFGMGSNGMLFVLKLGAELLIYIRHLDPTEAVDLVANLNLLLP